MRVTVRIEDEALLKDLKSLSKAAQGAALGEALMVGAEAVGGFARNNIQAHDLIDTSALVNSIETRLAKASGSKAEAEIGTNIVYAAIHEFGGVIKATAAKALHFVIDGVHVVTKSVTIPARPYLRPALDEHETEIGEVIGKELAKNIRRAL